MGNCEGCGSRPGISYKTISLTNGSLHLCVRCLDDISRKNPELIAAKALLARYEAACGPIEEAETNAAMNASATADAMSPVQPKEAKR